MDRTLENRLRGNVRDLRFAASEQKLTVKYANGVGMQQLAQSTLDTIEATADALEITVNALAYSSKQEAAKENL